ncbi:putative Uncharacterized transporter [Glarea lozoyensis 74030]|uniref:Putative Uncharacterized transporter n=1 Tax=Glarea lozoyensis (strain ATCC 74030 / MF5533) TaxID=1104152 RepID=H0EMT6_GLAL7|nr:putative Uncharacterized transporter [Glarea lozoyensis 74030]
MASIDPEKSAHEQQFHASTVKRADDISPASSTHADEAYELYKNGKGLDIDPAEYKRVLRKIDFRIIPIFVYGLKKGTHLQGQDYSWLVFGGLIGYAVGHITTGLAKWMYVFLIFGSVSIAWGIVSLIFLPDLPSTTKFLTESERLVAVARVAANRQGVKNHHFSKYQAWQTVKDPKTWILFVMATGAQVPNSALTSFTSIIVGSFGFDTLGGAVQFLALIAGGFVCTKWPNNTRCLTMIFANSVCIIGAGLLVGLPTDNKWGRLVALWLCYFQGLGFSLSLTMEARKF